MFTEVFNDTPNVAVDRMNYSHVVVHIALILPFSQCLTREFILLKLLDDRVVIAIPLCTLWRRHTVVVRTSPWFKSRSSMDLVLFIGHLIIVDKVHILDDAHLLLLSSKSSSIVIIEGFRQRIGHVVIKTQVASVRIPYSMRRFIVH